MGGGQMGAGAHTGAGGQSGAPKLKLNEKKPSAEAPAVQASVAVRASVRSEGTNTVNSL